MTPTLIKKFTGKFMWATFLGLVVLDILSFATLHTQIETVLFSIAVAILILLAIRRPEWLLPIAIAEIIATSNGHSLNIDLFGVSIGLRIALFAVLLTVSAIKIGIESKNPVPNRYRIVSFLLFAVVVYGVILGLLNGNSLSNIYLDANGYLAIGYIICAWVWIRDSNSRRRILQATGAGILWISVKTLLFLFAFGHLSPKTLATLYVWIRDTRLGEITLQGSNIYRVFLQSQWFLIPAIITTTSYILITERFRETGVRIMLMVASAGILASLSRSFWVALVATIPLLIIFTIQWNGCKNFMRRVPDFLAIKIGAIALLWVIIAIPIYQSTNLSFFGDLLSNRATATSDAAIDSRQSLFTPMISAIIDSPASGHGLGTALSYKTSDPRWIENNDTDTVETYAFEWGWLDIWIKFGIIGVFAIVWLLYIVSKDIWVLLKIDAPRRWLYVSMALSMIGIYVVHFFSPYLNHPIGWGTIAIVIALIPFEDNRLEDLNIGSSKITEKLRSAEKVTARSK